MYEQQEGEEEVGQGKRRETMQYVQEITEASASRLWCIDLYMLSRCFVWGGRVVARFIPEAVRKTFLKGVIDEQSIAKNNEKQKIRGSLYASDYGQCQRRVYFQFFPEEYPVGGDIDARTARVFGNGNSVHERLGEYLKRVPELDFRDELDVPRDELNVHGRCDGICTVEEQALVVEFKSINKEYVDEFKEEHLGQVMWYMGMMRKLRNDLYEDFGLSMGDPVNEHDLETPGASGRILSTLTPMEKWLLLTQGEIRGEIIYEGKPNQETYHFPVTWDEDKFKKIRLWFEQVKWHVDNKEVPQVKYYSSKYPCRWGRGGPGSQCTYHSICYPD
jgi:hypothetical protein